MAHEQQAIADQAQGPDVIYLATMLHGGQMTAWISRQWCEHDVWTDDNSRLGAIASANTTARVKWAHRRRISPALPSNPYERPGTSVDGQVWPDLLHSALWALIGVAHSAGWQAGSS